MKKARRLMLLTLIAMLTLLVLIGCEKENHILSVSLKDHDPETVIEVAVGQFDCSAYTLIISYNSGEAEEIPLAEEMVTETDLFKLYQVGEHDITVNYGEQQYSFKVSVKRATFDAVAFPESSVFTYDGAVHTVEVQGDFPANTIVTYPGGNSFVNAGTYDVTAIVSCEGYVTAKLTTTVTIERAKYDMSGVFFDEREFVYDGIAHSVAVSGTLPVGIAAPTYYINGSKTASAVDVGEYTVKASFANPNPNYENIPDMLTTLRITPAVYELEGVDLVFKNEDGSVISGLEKVYDGKGVSFEINNRSLIGSKLYVSYDARDAQGDSVSSFKNAGVYTVRMNVTLIDGKNYQDLPPITRTFVIKKAKYDTSNIYFDSALVTYDGTAHKVLVSLPTGHDIKPEDILYEYRLGDQLLQVDPRVGVTDAGVYTVTAIFPVKNENYEQITGIKPAILRIDKKTVVITEVGFSGSTLLEYDPDAEPYVPQFLTWQQTNGTGYDPLAYSARKYYKQNEEGQYVEIDGAPTDAGYYKCIVTLRIADDYAENYTLQDDVEEVEISFSFEICPKELDLSLLQFENYSNSIYDGSPKVPTIDISAYPEFVVMQTRYFQLNGSNYFEITTLPTVAGSYQCVVTVAVVDDCAGNYVLTDGHLTADLLCEYQIRPQRIDVTAIIEKGVNEPLEYNLWEYEDMLAEIKRAAQQRVSQMLPDHQNDINLWYLDSNSSGVSKITKAGEYTVYMLITNNCYTLFDGTSEVNAVTIMHIQVND